MIKLFDNLVIDYTFSGMSAATSPHDVIYVGQLGSMAFDTETAPLAKYPTLNDLVGSAGGVEGLVQKALDHPARAYLISDERTVYRFLIRVLRGAFPEIDASMAHRLVKLVVVNQKYGEMNRPKYRRDQRQHRADLKLPTPRETERWWREAAGQPPFSASVLRHLVFELKIAHAVAVGFTADDPLVQRLVDDINYILWRSLVRDVLKLKRRMVMGIFRWQEMLGTDIDPLSATLDDDMQCQSQGQQDLHYIPPELLGEFPRNKANAHYLQTSLDRLSRLIRLDDAFRMQIANQFAKEGMLSLEWITDVMATDRKQGWSRLFNRNKEIRGSNATWLGYFLAADSQSLATLRLASTQ